MVLANVTAVEVAVSGSLAVSYGWRSRTVLFMNDSSTVPVEIFIGGGGPMTLKPLETVSGKLWIEGLRVSAPSSASCRFWAWG